MDVKFSDNVLEELNDLVTILFEKEYFGFIDSAIDYVDRLMIHAEINIPNTKAKTAPIYFMRYNVTHYITYRSNKRTSWYIFFEHKADYYIINYITNNHSKGQHIRGLK